MAGMSKKRPPWATHLWKAAMSPPGMLPGSAGMILGCPAWQSPAPVEPRAVKEGQVRAEGPRSRLCAFIFRWNMN